jgi:hypothetical protein
MEVGAGETRFSGATMGETHDNIMVLNTDGDAFVASTGQVKVQPFRAYFSMKADVDHVSLPGTDTEGIAEECVADDVRTDVFYNLSGQRVSTPHRGIYIRNHKKILVW